MDRILIDTLEEQIAAGNKADNGWKSVSSQQVRTNIKCKLDMEINIDNVKNRLKTWKESYTAMSYLLNKSGFGRILTNNTLTAPDSVRKDFLKDNPQYSKYRDKSLDTFDEIETIIGNDQATGSEAQTAALAESNLRDDDTMPNLPIIVYDETTSHANNGEGTSHANNSEGTSHANNSEGTGSEPSSRSNATPCTTKDNVNTRKRKNREDAACKKESMSQMA
ncbi:hypothetical protein C5167_020611 [Papaver somniferum]|uniref:Myb/SANT-like domain-containing protein n=1 Tax=Papaver somniferum TaxID=3469 RepID=A0A4Y7IXI2_PAPSO|nr:uncharacterized protein LOC113349931 [Papaver somniferum]RZC52189.1 hypothetical protein C5167_020611 [Papaver somniferum]